MDSKVFKAICVIGGVIIGACSGYVSGEKFSADANYIWATKFRTKGEPLSEPINDSKE